MSFSVQRFSIGTQFTLNNESFEVKRLLPTNEIRVVSITTGELLNIEFDELYRAVLEERLQFITESSLKSPYIDLGDIPPALKKIAEERQAIVEQLLVLSPWERRPTMKKLISDSEKQLSERTIYRWIKDYEASGEDLRALVPRNNARGGKSKSRLCKDVDRILKCVIDDIFLVRERRTHKYIHREVAVRVEEENHHRPPDERIKYPSLSTVRRRILELDTEQVLTAKHGKQVARQRLTQFGKTDYPNFPLARVEIDHTPVDLIVVDEQDHLPLGRLTLTYCIDTASRYPLGFYLGFEPPSHTAVMECLYHAILPKGDLKTKYDTDNQWLAHGVPLKMVVDNGKEFISKSLEDVCESLKIGLQYTPVKTPHFKAAVERSFKTLNEGLFHMLPGTTFSNPTQRGDYNSAKRACISLNKLNKMLNIYLVDVYANEPHRGLGNTTPANRWANLCEHGFFPRVPPSLETFQILLGRVTHRTIQHYGIEFENLRFNSPDLIPLRTRLAREDNKKVKIKFNPSDLSRVHVYDHFEKRYITVPAVYEEYTKGLSLWKHKIICAQARLEAGKVDIVALGRAQRKLQAIVEESMATTKKQRTRNKAARWQHSGKTATVEDSKSLKPESSTELLEDALPIAPPEEALNNDDFIIDLDNHDEDGWG